MTDGVPDTLYLPLAARIYSSERFPEYFRDDTALSLKDSKAIIDPAQCTGCGLCAQLCPVRAITAAEEVPHA